MNIQYQNCLVYATNKVHGAPDESDHMDTCIEKIKWPSGSASVVEHQPMNQRWLVGFHVKAHVWVAGWILSRGRAGGN